MQPMDELGGSDRSAARRAEGQAPVSLAEIVCRLSDGGTVTIYEPVGPANCDRCRRKADDVCFRISLHDGTIEDGGLCSACLAVLLRGAASHG